MLKFENVAEGRATKCENFSAVKLGETFVGLSAYETNGLDTDQIWFYIKSSQKGGIRINGAYPSNQETTFADDYKVVLIDLKVSEVSVK